MATRPRKKARIARSFVAILAALCLGTGCIPRYGVRAVEDDFEGVQIQRMHGNVLGDPDRGGEWIELNAELFRRRGAAPRYAFVLLYRDADAWLRIPAGKSLLALVDGEAIALRGSGSRRHRTTRLGRGVEEEARYEIGADVLRRMARAESVRFRIIGSREYVERVFTPENRDRLRAFVEEHMDEAPRSSP